MLVLDLELIMQNFNRSNSTTISTMAALSVLARPHVEALLKALHSRSLEEESTLPTPMPPRCTPEFDNIMRDKFIALDQDKCGVHGLPSREPECTMKAWKHEALPMRLIQRSGKYQVHTAILSF